MKRDILERALKGDRFTDLHIVDAHCHMGNYYNYYFPEADIDKMVEDADIVGVERMCIAPHAAISNDYKLGNRQLLEAVQRYPDRVYGLLTLNPHQPKEIDGEFDRYYSVEQFIGVKIHPDLHKYPITGDNYIKIFDKMKKVGGILLTHTWAESGNNSVSMCEEIIDAYPEIVLILGHAGGLTEEVQKAAQLVNKYNNAYLDTSGFEYSNIWIEELVSMADNSKILFGSDFPFHDLRGGISRILFADLDDDIKLKILSGNFREAVEKSQKKTAVM